MQDFCNYQIELLGLDGEADLNAMSPIHMTYISSDLVSALFAICTDQSGLVGLLRHLHGRGLLILSVYRERETVISR